MKWHQIFFWLLLLFLPTQLGFHFWPDWAMVLGRRVDYLAPTFYLTDILVVFTVGIYSISNIQYPISKKMFLFLMPIVLFVVLNVSVATNHFVAIYKWLKVLEFISLGWYIVRTKPTIATIVTPLSIGVFYSSVLAMAQFLLQHSVGGPLWWLGERTFSVDTPGIARFDSCQLSAVSCQLFLRPYATFPHPNVLGGFLAAVLPLLALRYLSILGNLKKKIKLFYGIVLAVGVIALLLTFSRSAIIVGILALVLVFFQKKKIIFFLAILFLAFSFFPALPAGRLFPFSFFEESVIVRQQLNVAAVKIWQSSPLFGVGLGNFLVRLPEELPTRTIYFLQPVHNIYLLLLSEVGIVGIGIIIISLWALRRQETRDKRQGAENMKQETRDRRQGKWKFERVACLLSLVSLLILGLIDHYPLTLQQGQLLFTLLVGMSLQEVRKVKK